MHATWLYSVQCRSTQNAFQQLWLYIPATAYKRGCLFDAYMFNQSIAILPCPLTLFLASLSVFVQDYSGSMIEGYTDYSKTEVSFVGMAMQAFESFFDNAKYGRVDFGGEGGCLH